jgi:hypothetical protein
MSFLAIVIKIGMWFKNIIMFPGNLAKVASVNKDLELQQKLSETQQRLEKAEKCLARDAAIKAGRMFFDNNVFWAKNEKGDIEDAPYCPRCFELDGKAVHLITFYTSYHGMTGKCPECKTDEIRFGESE